ncbi:MAG: peptidoglycan DD-metalloendopeptidase family protein [Chitinophagales bacterium]|nr:peptidoglycan DD-metalloendopeptidase family protein [Chitinophagales bacterium]
MKLKLILITLLSFIGLTTATLYLGDQDNDEPLSAVPILEIEEPILDKGIQLYGMEIDTAEVVFSEVRRNQFLSDILTAYNIDYTTIEKLATIAKPVFDVRKMREGNPYCILVDSDDSIPRAKCLIYEENKVNYIVFNLDDTVSVYRGQKEVTILGKEASGVIQTSLYETMTANKINPDLALRLSEIYAWTVDFYRIQKGDRFKVVYTEKMVEGESVGIGEITAVLFNHMGKDLYGFYYEKDSIHAGDYFEPDGKSLRKAFLQAPVKYSRISSRYSGRRFHPVQKRYKAHLGTDYAAPHGTPIYATADGVISEATYRRYNGRYVKVRHNGTYSTQYLHMSKIAKNIRPGVFVKQGEIIGYVGSTGLATGPHVCYRFWKNGQQVDPYKQDIPDADPLGGEDLEYFHSFYPELKRQLDEISYPGEHDVKKPIALLQNSENAFQ